MKLRATLAAAASVLSLSGCMDPMERATSSHLNPAPLGGSKDDLRMGEAPPVKASDVRVGMYNPKEASKGLTALRADALKESAQGYGSQMGYWRRSWEIGHRLEERSLDLSQVFDFNRVVSAAPVKAGVIVPPVVSRSFEAFVTPDGGRSASVADEYLTIVSAGRIAPVAPTWRDFLIFGSSKPEDITRSMLPQNAEEMARFEEWKEAGWKAGVELADAEFEERMNRLKRDYTGMLQYRRLVAMGMMDRMVLADADFGVTTSGNEMRIGSRTVEIVSDAQFQGNPAKWKVRTVSERDALIVATGEIPSLTGLD
ncbi:type IV secretory system conjugative DNA transfer family protein [Paracoccus litorisediminis]|uniref:type IV secretory system conjugative DNA transfer family protein n=1 Tax=Paracoccus litorisediminis TaxID=2006130 RepID=UPI003730681A